MKTIVISLLLLLLPACGKMPEGPGPSREPLVPESSVSVPRPTGPSVAVEDARVPRSLAPHARRKPVTRWM
ncbi:MAG TPA: hypothetical protein VMN03_13855 [Burkholderiales bacterium]|nr:hypothetical protein [Burkholderiales bacterium]